MWVTFYHNDLAMRNTTDVTSDKPIVVLSQAISGLSVVSSLVAFYDIHGNTIINLLIINNIIRFYWVTRLCSQKIMVTFNVLSGN
jgi:hypothetical protein